MRRTLNPFFSKIDRARYKPVRLMYGLGIIYRYAHTLYMVTHTPWKPLSLIFGFALCMEKHIIKPIWSVRYDMYICRFNTERVFTGIVIFPPCTEINRSINSASRHQPYVRRYKFLFLTIPALISQCVASSSVCSAVHLSIAGHNCLDITKAY